MKFAIFFALATFAVVAQVHAKPVDDLERGQLADALKKKLAEAKEKLNELANQASDALKEQIAQAQKEAEKLIDQLSEKVTEATDKIFQAAEKVIEKIAELEDKIIQGGENKGNN